MFPESNTTNAVFSLAFTPLDQTHSISEGNLSSNALREYIIVAADHVEESLSTSRCLVDRDDPEFSIYRRTLGPSTFAEMPVNQVLAGQNDILVRIDVKPKHKRFLQNKLKGAITLQDRFKRLEEKVDEDRAERRQERAEQRQERAEQRQKTERLEWELEEQRRETEKLKMEVEMLNKRLATITSEKLSIEHALAIRELLKCSRERLYERYKHTLPEGFPFLSRQGKAQVFYNNLNGADRRRLHRLDVGALFGAETAKFDGSLYGTGNAVAHRAGQREWRDAIEACKEPDLQELLNRIFDTAGWDRLGR